VLPLFVIVAKILLQSGQQVGNSLLVNADKVYSGTNDD
jgi:hypothetical protein